MASDTTSADAKLRRRLEGLLAGAKTDRYSWWVHWQQLATYELPRRYRWLVTPNQMNRGMPINGAIMDSTGTIAARTCASGMMSGVTSPTAPWFKLRIVGFPEDEVTPVGRWLSSCQTRMQHVLSESNFYQSIATIYLDLVVFGTACMLMYEDRENIAHFYNPCLGEYYVMNDARLQPGKLLRELTMTCSQVVEEFGEENCSDQIREAYKRGDGASLAQEYLIYHVIEKNDDRAVNSKFDWYEAYWEQSSQENKFLRKRGFYDKPFMVARWETSGNDAYGRSPGMDALGDIKQLQQETKRKAQAIDKLANPPMVADVELKNQPASTLPGGVTYVAKKDGAGFAPAYQNFRPPVNEMMLDIQQVQARIKDIFFNDLFLMISNLDTVRTATEIDARKEEKLVMLGPVLERFQTEGLDPVIDRLFNIMARTIGTSSSLFDPPPPEIANRPIKIEYVSMLAEAQKAAQTVGLERFFATLGNIAAIRPEILDIPNWDRSMTRYALSLGNDPTDINTADELAAIREARAKQAQEQQQAQMSMAAVQGAKTLSETDVGGGQNALQQIMFGPGGQAA